MADTQATEPAPAPASLDERLDARAAAEAAMGEMVMTDDGDLELVRPEPDPDAQPDEAGGDRPSPAEVQQARETINELKDEGPPVAEGDSYEERYKNLQGWATKLRQNQAILEKEVAYLKGRDSTREKDENIEALDLLDTFSDPKQGVEFISDIAADMIRGLYPTLTEYEARIASLEADNSVRNELLDAMKEPDFTDWVKPANEVMSMFPDQDMTIAQAVTLAKKMAAGAGHTAPEGTPSGAPQPGSGTRISAEEARRRAARSKVETSTVAGDPSEPTETPIRSAREAVESAFNEALANNL